MAPARQGRVASKDDEGERGFEQGAAFGKLPSDSRSLTADSWPTYRGDAFRSGYSNTSVAEKPGRTWTTSVGGRLSAPVVAAGNVFVASVDQNAVHALDARSGQPIGTYSVGGPVDSPPTICKGYAIFGCSDGWVYCLRASDGVLARRRRAASSDRRIVVRNRLESPWPVPGSVLVQDDVVYCLAGRSSYLDGRPPAAG